MNDLIITNDMLSRSVFNYGNPYRILKLFEKAAKGEKITYAAIGGSITQRFNATPDTCYAALLAKYLKEKFPQAEIEFINAGIGATGSLIGVHRLYRDVLSHNPDFVTVEYSVNDSDSEETVESYDNLIYNVLNYTTAPAVLCIGMVSKVGKHAQESHIKAARHYDLPFISYRNAVWSEIEAGNITWDMLSNDDVHPIEAGHSLVARLVENHLDDLSGKSSADFSDNNCKTPFTNNKFLKGRIYQIGDIKTDSFGVFEKEEVQLNTIPYGWLAEKNGEPLKISFKDCHRVYMMVKRSDKGGKAVAEGLGKEVELDSLFEASFTYFSPHLICESEKAQDIEISVTPDLNEDEQFAIAGFLVS